MPAFCGLILISNASPPPISFLVSLTQAGIYKSRSNDCINHKICFFAFDFSIFFEVAKPVRNKRLAWSSFAWKIFSFFYSYKVMRKSGGEKHLGFIIHLSYYSSSHHVFAILQVPIAMKMSAINLTNATSATSTTNADGRERGTIGSGQDPVRGFCRGKYPPRSTIPARFLDQYSFASRAGDANLYASSLPLKNSDMLDSTPRLSVTGTIHLHRNTRSGLFTWRHKILHPFFRPNTSWYGCCQGNVQ